ncbi:MAG: FtsW/RodA/SpoVE family cell cycle protein [Verrucomicrobiales bacterium]
MGKIAPVALCLAVLALVGLGVVILASTSVWDEGPAMEYFHLKRQILWLVAGLVLAGFLMVTDYRLLKDIWLPLALVSTVLLLLCYVPGIRVESNGEARWIKAPLIGRFQPSELAKLTSMISLAAWYAKYQAEKRTFWKGFVLPGALIGVPIVLVLFETDMGTAAAMSGAGFLLLFVAGARLRYLFPTILAGALALVVVVQSNDNRRKRIEAFQNLEEHRLGVGLQQYRSIMAFANGGVAGVGLGNGLEKHGYLPEAHTDFIFPMVGEELGLRVTLGVVFCFVMISVFGIQISLAAPDLFGRLLGVGLTAVIIVPAVMNMGVTTVLLPNTGLPLPFVSYGGSSLVFTLAMVGLLLSIHRRVVLVERAELPVIKEKKLEIRI